MTHTTLYQQKSGHGMTREKNCIHIDTPKYFVSLTAISNDKWYNHYLLFTGLL